MISATACSLLVSGARSNSTSSDTRVGRQRLRRRKSTAVLRANRNSHDSNTAGSRSSVSRRTILMNTIWTTSSTALG